ncbi:hypothetical protein ARMGADRAFT_1038616 [Armillaria gallica]|uniref:Uncharacterized protein n=1 Tax=Armillaria gallica TaxID=47427 RepID=A0A2H3CHB2_ARMGA|nr:hypothetical protein ARMGADRAFT_1038616 [Armillaria gallica]
MSILKILSQGIWDIPVKIMLHRLLNIHSYNFQPRLTPWPQFVSKLIHELLSSSKRGEKNMDNKTVAVPGGTVYIAIEAQWWPLPYCWDKWQLFQDFHRKGAGFQHLPCSRQLGDGGVSEDSSEEIVKPGLGMNKQAQSRSCFAFGQSLLDAASLLLLQVRCNA